jgi:hypothetical protein
LRYNVEISFDIKTILFIELTLLRLTLPFISIDKVPLLVEFSVLVPDEDVSLFSINVALDIHNLSFLVDEEWRFISEHLPPS